MFSRNLACAIQLNHRCWRAFTRCVQYWRSHPAIGSGSRALSLPGSLIGSCLRVNSQHAVMSSVLLASTFLRFRDHAATFPGHLARRGRAALQAPHAAYLCADPRTPCWRAPDAVELQTKLRHPAAPTIQDIPGPRQPARHCGVSSGSGPGGGGVSHVFIRPPRATGDEATWDALTDLERRSTSRARRLILASRLPLSHPCPRKPSRDSLARCPPAVALPQASLVCARSTSIYSCKTVAM